MKRIATLLVTVLSTMLLLAPFSARAQETLQSEPEATVGLYPKSMGVEYFCTDAEGARRELGQVICITASCTTSMARCEMAGNNNLAIWRKIQDGCPGTSLEGSVLGRLQQFQPPV